VPRLPVAGLGPGQPGDVGLRRLQGVRRGLHDQRPRHHPRGREGDQQDGEADGAEQAPDLVEDVPPAGTGAGDRRRVRDELTGGPGSRHLPSGRFYTPPRGRP
jgi:hypothetical protein